MRKCEAITPEENYNTIIMYVFLTTIINIMTMTSHYAKPSPILLDKWQLLMTDSDLPSIVVVTLTEPDSMTTCVTWGATCVLLWQEGITVCDPDTVLPLLTGWLDSGYWPPCEVVFTVCVVLWRKFPIYLFVMTLKLVTVGSDDYYYLPLPVSSVSLYLFPPLHPHSPFLPHPHLSWLCVIGWDIVCVLLCQWNWEMKTACNEKRRANE